MKSMGNYGADQKYEIRAFFCANRGLHFGYFIRSTVSFRKGDLLHLSETAIGFLPILWLE